MELLNSLDIPLRARPVGCPVPLTASQLRMWNRAPKKGAPLSYLRMCAVSMRLSGPLNVYLLKNSIESVVQRHESLRTKIVIVDGVPVQHVDAELHDYFEFVDLTSIPLARREQEAVYLGQKFMEKKVDISVGPLLEAKILKLSDQDHVLLIGLDHIVSDEASHGILNREIWTLYRQPLANRPISLPCLSIQFPDYAVWQQSTYDRWLEEHGPYWKQYLFGAPSTLITEGNGSPITERHVVTRSYFPFGKTLSGKLNEIAQRERVRLPLVVLTAYAVIMSWWCSQRELLLLFVSHGRHGHPDLKNTIGPLANALHVRLEIGNDDSFLDVLKKVRLELDAAHQHRDFDRVRYLMPECDTDLCFNWLPAVEALPSVLIAAQS